MINYSEETVYQLWDNTHGVRTEVGPDSDGLGVIELREIEGGPTKVIRSMTLNEQQAEFLLRVLPRAIADMRRTRT